MKTKLVLICLFVMGCEKNKEAELKSAMNSAVPVVDPVELAKSQPNFENEINAGFALSQKKEHEQALIFFRKALERSPSSPIALNNICAELNATQKWVSAVKNCELALSKAPEFELAKNNLAFAKAKISETEKLIAQTDLQLKSKGKLPVDLAIDHGFNLYKLEKYTEAISIWKKIVTEKSEQKAIILNNIASAKILNGNFAEAKEDLAKAKSLDPKNQLIDRNQAWLQSLTGGQ